nr:MAG TPA: hypothetical protein [Caudoviricetes sp.]
MLVFSRLRFNKSFLIIHVDWYNTHDREFRVDFSLNHNVRMIFHPIIEFFRCVFACKNSSILKIDMRKLFIFLKSCIN